MSDQGKDQDKIRVSNLSIFSWRLETYHVSELQPGEVVGWEQLGPALLGQVDVEVDGGVQDCQEMGDLADGVNPARPLVLLLVL